jgi:hypothetical protein
MKKKIELFLLLCFPHFLCAQSLPNQLLTMTGGYSRHGSGDMSGIVFGAEYSKYRSQRISIHYNFRGSITNQTHSIILTNRTSDQIQDASQKYTTAGVQAGLGIGCSLLRNKRHEILLCVGGFGRYQSSSNPGGYSIYTTSAVTGIPTVLLAHYNNIAQQTYAAGGLLQIHYNFTFNKKLVLGLSPGFQTDTNGDALLQVVMIAGKRF